MVKQRVIVSANLPIEELGIIEEAGKIAKREGTSISMIIRRALKDYVKKHASGNPAFALDTWVSKPSFMAFPTLGEDADVNYLKQLSDEDLKQLIGHAESWLYLAEKERDRR